MIENVGKTLILKDCTTKKIIGAFQTKKIATFQILNGA